MAGTSDPLADATRMLADPDALRLHIRRALADRPAANEPVPAGLRRAAVLLPLVDTGKGPALVLTKRTDLVEHHKGQISFPGGGLEDGETPEEAALRETHEEIGIRPSDVEILGRLDDQVMSFSGFLVTPFVGFVPFPNRLLLSPQEVGAILVMPLEVMLDARNVRTEVWDHGSRPSVVYFYTAGREVIWGFTARIIAQFFEVVFGIPLKSVEGAR